MESNPNSGRSFKFININQNPDDAKDRVTRQLARSHAVTRALENKRKRQQESGQNFRVAPFQIPALKGSPSRSVNPSQALGKRTRTQTLDVLPFPPPAVALDPFQMLAADSSRLQALLSYRKPFFDVQDHLETDLFTLKGPDKAKGLAEPVLSVSDELVLRNFRSILRTGLDDTALLNAFILTFLVTVTNGSIPGIDLEYLKYQSQAMRSIRESISGPDSATSESMLGAILLLAGVEARRGMPIQVQFHMTAVRQLLDLCQGKGVYLSDGIKRAIFWQDLNSSIMAGSNRIVDHTTFAELQWSRDPFSPHYFILPPGFQKQSHLLSEEFVEILEDVHALQCIRDYALFSSKDTLAMARIDNHQASIQSRLAGLSTPSSIVECCRLAAYLCSTMLRCKIWPASVIPSHLSLQLLHKLQQANNDPAWNDNPDLLTWLLYTGGAFAPAGVIRSNYALLLRLHLDLRLGIPYGSLPELLKVLKQFIWSEKSFLSRVEAFWEESLA